MNQDGLPSPISNGDSAAYWEGAARGKLLLRKCNACEALHFMPRFACPACWSEDLEWVEASGSGTVHSFTVIRRASDPAFADRVPYVVALIDLAEGPRMVTNIVGDTALDCAIGDRVSVLFEQRADGTAVPQFQRSA